MTKQEQARRELIESLLPWHVVLPGRPVVQKNSKRIVTNRRSGRPMLLSSQSCQDWTEAAVYLLRSRWGARPTIPVGAWLNAAIVSYCDARQSPDASNLYEAPQDALQQAGIIANDYWIRTHDGSDRRRDERYPRVEITLSVAQVS